MLNHIKAIALTATILTGVGCASSPEENTSAKGPEQTAGPVATVDVANGKSLFGTCAACHGQNAEGTASLNAPALAGQESYYLKKQLENFRSGKRGKHADDTFGAQMAPMAAVVSGQGEADVIAYIESLPSTKKETAVKGNVENGKNYYNMICGACHGNGAVGIEALFSPKLVGLQDWYLERQIDHFRKGVRGTAEGDVHGAQMQQIATSIPDDQTVKDVVAYINSLQAE